MDQDRKTHPSYGHAVFCRTQGRVKLFASPMQFHNQYITLKISRSELGHSLGEDYRYPGEQLIEVAFSPAQFAQLLTAMNVGEGVPCTIQRLGGEQIPAVPEDDETELQRIKADFKDSIEDLLASLDAKKRLANDILDKKTALNKSEKEQLRNFFNTVVREVSSNWPFALTQFQRAASRAESAMKAEVESLITSAVHKLGLQKLAELTKALSEGKSTPRERKRLGK